MKLVVGVDLRHRSDGAVRFAAWLRAHVQAPAEAELVGVHVVESGQMAALQRFDPRPTVFQRLRDEAMMVVRGAAGAEAFAKVDVLEGKKAAHSLESACIYHHADAMVIGRKAGVAEQALVRLGSVARALLRALPAPIFVVAPDLDPETIGAGPLVVAVTPTDASLSAAAFATRVAQRLGREIVFVRVVTVPEDYAHIYWSGDALASFRSEYVARSRQQLGEWLATHGYGGARYEVRYGAEVGEVVAAARENDAPLIVCGSRLLGPLERMLTPSTSSELAAHAHCAVAVVPPDYRVALEG